MTDQPPVTPRRFEPGFDDLPHLPKYQRLANWLEQQIAAGAFPADSAIPTEEALCRMFRLSRGTVQQAVQSLVQKGLVRREQGRGTFVNTPRRADVTSFTLASFDELMRRQGRTPGTLLVAAQVLDAPPAVAERLALAPATPVIRIERIRLADGAPTAWEERFLAHALCPDLLAHDLERSSIHRLLIDHYHLPLVRMEHVVELRPAPDDAATLLRLPAGQPLFFVDRLTSTLVAGLRTPAVWFRAYYHERMLALGTASVTP
jgi:GntR family transcriptional regulator